MILLTLYAPGLKLVIRCTAGWFEWLVLPSHVEDVCWQLAYAHDWEPTKQGAVKIGREQLDYWSEQLGIIK